MASLSVEWLAWTSVAMMAACLAVKWAGIWAACSVVKRASSKGEISAVESVSLSVVVSVDLLGGTTAGVWAEMSAQWWVAMLAGEKDEMTVAESDETMVGWRVDGMVAVWVDCSAVVLGVLKADAKEPKWATHLVLMKAVWLAVLTADKMVARLGERMVGEMVDAMAVPSAGCLAAQWAES